MGGGGWLAAVAELHPSQLYTVTTVVGSPCATLMYFLSAIANDTIDILSGEANDRRVSTLALSIHGDAM